MRTLSLATTIVAVALASLALILGAVQAPRTGAGRVQQPPMPMGPDMDGGPAVPPVHGYARGQDILFIHTEASDPQVAAMLTDMMGSPVLLVPRLVDVPPLLLADVFVFTNGVPGAGPMGYQADVFDQMPGEDGYSPLRAVHLVTWANVAAPRTLRSAEEVRAAAATGEVTITRSGAVVNMPLLTWPGGQR